MLADEDAYVEVVLLLFFHQTATSHDVVKVMNGPDTLPKQSKRAQSKATHVFHDHDSDEP